MKTFKIYIDENTSTYVCLAGNASLEDAGPDAYYLLFDNRKVKVPKVKENDKIIKFFTKTSWF